MHNMAQYTTEKFKVKCSFLLSNPVQTKTVLIKNSLKVEVKHLQKLRNRRCQGWMGYLAGSYTGLSLKRVWVGSRRVLKIDLFLSHVI